MQIVRVLAINSELLNEARRRLRRVVYDPFSPLDKNEFSQGCVELCPFCKYQTKKHPKGSACVRGNRFKCFSCGISRRVE